jgi:hypothetical protein
VSVSGGGDSEVGDGTSVLRECRLCCDSGEDGIGAAEGFAFSTTGLALSSVISTLSSEGGFDSSVDGSLFGGGGGGDLDLDGDCE